MAECVPSPQPGWLPGSSEIWECALAEQKGPFGARLLIWGRVLPFLPVR